MTIKKLDRYKENLTINDHYNLTEAVMKAINNHFKTGEEDEINQ